MFFILFISTQLKIWNHMNNIQIWMLKIRYLSSGNEELKSLPPCIYWIGLFILQSRLKFLMPFFPAKVVICCFRVSLLNFNDERFIKKFKCACLHSTSLFSIQRLNFSVRLDILYFLIKHSKVKQKPSASLN